MLSIDCIVSSKSSFLFQDMFICVKHSWTCVKHNRMAVQFEEKIGVLRQHSLSSYLSFYLRRATLHPALCYLLPAP